MHLPAESNHKLPTSFKSELSLVVVAVVGVVIVVVGVAVVVVMAAITCRKICCALTSAHDAQWPSSSCTQSQSQVLEVYHLANQNMFLNIAYIIL